MSLKVFEETIKLRPMRDWKAHAEQYYMNMEKWFKEVLDVEFAKFKKQLQDIIYDAFAELNDQKHNIAPVNTRVMNVVDAEDVFTLITNIRTKLFGKDVRRYKTE